MRVNMITLAGVVGGSAAALGASVAIAALSYGLTGLAFRTAGLLPPRPAGRMPLGVRVAGKLIEAG